MQNEQAIRSFLETLRQDRQFKEEITAYQYIPPKEPIMRDIGLQKELREVLQESSISSFYMHQAEGIGLIRQGKNVVVMTPTASGKSLIYTIPIIESILDNPEAKALCIFPLKGLEQDQVKKLNELLEKALAKKYAGVDTTAPGYHWLKNARAEVYDGDTTPYRRKKIRENIPNVLFTNPDMLHLAFEPYHRKWGEFFKNLRYVVVDEIHTYRGVFGSNVSHVLRRLRRICNYWGSNPQFIASSATIANPKELAEMLAGIPFELVDTTGAPQSGKHFIFLNPLDSAYTEATRLFVKCIHAGLRTILFTKARKITELIYKWSVERAPLLKDKISPYRAGFLPAERREIEQKLFSGELVGVISTSALELGVDIGGLDVCILCGYPGSISSTWQRAGRVGRHGQESLIAMVAIKDALDHYFISHPEAFFEKPHEAATCDPENEKILRRHILCAAEELFIRKDDPVYSSGEAPLVIEELEAEGSLKRGKSGDLWLSQKRRFHSEMGIRSIGRPFKLKDERYKPIGDLDGRRIYRDAFPGAIYLHRGRQYEVLEFDLAGNQAICRETDVNYYTHALSQEDIEIIGTPMKYPSLCRGEVELYHGNLRITYQVVGYDQKNIYDGTRMARYEVEMPDYIFETEGVIMIIDERIARELDAKGYDLSGTLHAAEHVLIASMPLFALCDKGDIGGLSYALNPVFRAPAIFMYDGYEGGVGLTRRALDIPEEWLEASRDIIRNCDCEDGCPTCVQDSQCGSANDPLDKQGALYFLKRLLNE